MLVLAIERDDVAPGALDGARAELRRSRHDVEHRRRAPATSAGKFEHLNALLAGARPGQRYDWLLVLDDDVDLPRGFLDRFLAAAEGAGLQLAQPAHRLHSHAAWDVTRRVPGAIARETTFVEIGPVTAFARATFAALLPFPRPAHGLGPRRALVGARRASTAGAIGIVDATPVGHTLRPAAATYPREAAIAEARAFLAGRPYVTPRRGPHAGGPPVKVAVVAEFYPRARRPGARHLGARAGARRAGGRRRGARRRAAPDRPAGGDAAAASAARRGAARSRASRGALDARRRSR